MLAERTGPLPDGWSIGRIDDFATECKQRAGHAGDLPVLSVSKHHGIVRSDQYFSKRVYGKDTSKYKVVQPGQFAYATIHLNEGSIGRLKELTPGIVSPMYTVFDVRHGIDPDYLFAVLKSERSLRVYETITQGTVKRRGGISFRTLSGLLLHYPPLSEQRKIAAILSSLDDAIEKTQAVIDQVQVVKRGLMQELFARGLPGWTKEKLGNLFTLQLGKMLNKNARETSPQFPYLGNRNVQWGRFDLSELREMHFDEREREKFKLNPGDLLVCEGGEVGRTALWTGESNCYYQKAIHRLRAKSAKVEPKFIVHFMQFAAINDLLSDFTSQSSIAHLTREKLALFDVPLPPLPEQRKIAVILTAADNAIKENQAVIDHLQVLKSALMSVLLTGELRVTPDPETR